MVGWCRIRRLLFAPLLLLPGACATSGGPPCPYRGAPDYASSAGCLAIVHSSVLVVESVYGGVTPPGGKVLAGESAQCAAHRETWEETGLDLRPGQLLQVFDTGFHLYYCEIHADSGLIEPGDKLEIRGGYWLPLVEFDDVQWRYRGQGAALRRILSQ